MVKPASHQKDCWLIYSSSNNDCLKVVNCKSRKPAQGSDKSHKLKYNSVRKSLTVLLGGVGDPEGRR